MIAKLSRRGVLALGAGTFLSAACNSGGVHAAAQTGPRGIWRAAIVPDLSKSSQRWNGELPTEPQLLEIAESLSGPGGYLSMFYVRESGKTLGAQLDLPMRTPPPSLGSNPFSQADARARLDFQARESKRRQESQTRIDVFVKQAVAEHSFGRESDESAVREALFFASRFLSAPTVEEADGAAVRRLLCVCSDCRDDSPRSPKFELPTVLNVETLWATPDPTAVFPLRGVQPKIFSTTYQALRYTAALLRSA